MKQNINPILLLILSIVFFAACGTKDSLGFSERGTVTISKRLSNGNVKGFAEDSKGHIWIATFRGINKYAVPDYYQYTVADSLGLESNIITSTFCDSQDRLWFTTYKGIYTYGEDGRFHSVYVEGSDLKINDIVESLDGNVYFSASNRLLQANQTGDSLFVVDYYNEFGSTATISQGPDGALWTCQERSLYKYVSGEPRVQEVSRLGYDIVHSCMTPNGDIWISGEKQLSIYDTTTDQLIPLPESIAKNKEILSSSIYYIYLLDETTILLCTLKNGIFCYNRKTQTLIHQDDSDFPIDVPSFRINTIFKDSKANVWFGSDNQGYKVVNTNANKFQIDKTLSSFFDGMSVISLAYERSGLLIISTLNDGLYSYNIGSKAINRIELAPIYDTQNIEKTYFNTVYVDENNHLWLLSSTLDTAFECALVENTIVLIEVIPVSGPISIAEDNSGGLWIGGVGEDILYVDEQKEHHTIKLYDKEAVAQYILPLGDTTVIVCSNTEYLRIVNPKTLGTGILPVASNTSTGLSTNNVKSFVLYNNEDGSFLVGSVETGVYSYSVNEQILRQVEPTASLDVYSIQRDRDGYLWIGTNEGLYRYNRFTGNVSKFSEGNGIERRQYYLRSSVMLPDGTLVFGGQHGITMFYPQNLTNEDDDNRIVFESLKIQNNLVVPGENSPISKDMSFSPDIKIKYYQNSFSISYSSLNYNEEVIPMYSCKLEGIDKNWVDVGDNNEVYYSNLPAGNYKFKVRLNNKIQEEDSNEAYLNIRVMPFPLLSTWAISLYIIVLLVVVFFYIRISTQRRKLELQLSHERLAAEQKAKETAEHDKAQIQMLNERQMTYFENIAHEFRTPLTMITGPIEALSQSSSLNNDDKKMLNVVNKSSGWLLMLVDQLLDFNRVSEGKSDLRVSRKNISAILKYLYDTFLFKAKSKNISFTLSGIQESFEMFIDEDKLLKIIINLLSNAFKFTPEGGQINLGFDVISHFDASELFRLNPEDEAISRYAKFTVSDSGVGIPEEKLDKIFDRFYQVSSFGTGSGIGLFYSMSLAYAHHGYLKALSSTEEGNSGTTFILLLPVGSRCYTEEEKIESTNMLNSLPATELYDVEEDNEVEGEEKRRLVVVDDDVDVANYLKLILSPIYSVSIFYGAETALRSIEAQHPDIIISDVAMPGMDGYEFCKSIKNNLETCHIPVILVTAKVMVSNQVQGLESGADAYVTKPFDAAYLKALLNSILDNRDRARKNISEITSEEDIEKKSAGLNPQDKYFLKELYSILESDISNPELDVNSISERMKISRTKLYNKIKDLTGESPSVLFKTYKLNMAAKLLLEGKYNMSEIADRTGFCALSHFSYSFKKQFGVPPSDYKG